MLGYPRCKQKDELLVGPETQHTVKLQAVDYRQGGSNEMPFTAWRHTERNRQRDKKVYHDFMTFRDSCSTE